MCYAESMNYFLDSEFSEDGTTIHLISLALVCEDGRELYLISKGFEPDACNDWVKANVLPKLPVRSDPRWAHRAEMRSRIEEFLKDDEKPVFWAYFADYDWVVFCWLWGAMVDLPEKFPMFCLDLKQVLWHMQVSNIKEHVPQSQDAHDALIDARWNRDVWAWAKMRAPANLRL